MKPIVRNIIYLAAVVAIAAASTFLFKMSKKSGSVITSSGDIIVKFTDDFQFLTEDQVREYIAKDCGVLTGKQIDSVNLSSIEAALDARSVVRKSEAYMTKNGDLHVIISQRRPVLRFQKGSEGMYADEQGYVFPVTGESSFDVTVVDGKLPDKDSAWVARMVGMSQWLEKSKVWSDKFVQIHAGEDGDLTLVPREGREKFLFGQPDNIISKFARLEDYYKFIAPSKEEGYYSTVSLKYDEHIVCKQ